VPGAEQARSVRDVKPAMRGWFALQRARLARRRHPDLGEISAYCFYATRLRFRELAFDIGANHGAHSEQMLNRGARVVVVEPQASLARELAARFPGATVLRLAVSDKPGQATLHLARDADYLASLDASWAQDTACTWDGSEEVEVTTLDDLIARYGEPGVVKIDTEGFDHRVLQGLSRPIEHILFEVHSTRRDAAADAFARLQALGHYEFRGAPLGSWLFRTRGAEEIMADVVAWGGGSEVGGVGEVYARRIG
jgi:FkbM family methyltransferase